MHCGQESADAVSRYSVFVLEVSRNPNQYPLAY